MRPGPTLPLLLVLSSLACGARTPLPVPDQGAAGGPDGEGAGAQVGTSGRASSGAGASDGGGGEGGAGGEGGEGTGGAGIECDPDLLFIYLVTSETDLYRFDPANNAFTRVGALACPSSAGSSPFSMAVSRRGRAYSVYNDGDLYRINVANADCRATDWAAIPDGEPFHLFGMGYALDGGGPGETLHVADISFQFPSVGLARLDPSTSNLEYIGPFSQNPGNAIELTSADDGELYGYFINQDVPGGTLVRIDKDTAEILEAVPLPPPTGGGSSLAFAYWNGDFYIFTGGGGFSEVTRYRPSDGSVGIVATLDRDVVGAGVSTCDPDDVIER